MFMANRMTCMLLPFALKILDKKCKKRFRAQTFNSQNPRNKSYKPTNFVHKLLPVKTHA